LTERALGGTHTLRLAPGAKATVRLGLTNACTPARGARLWLVLAGGTRRAGLGIGPAGRCDDPVLGPGYVVSGFLRATP
jgi:hypothetical protein